MKTVRLCMIGAGRHASRLIYSSFPLLQNAEIVANADLDQDKAQGIARRYGIARTYTDYRRMLEVEKPDGVVVCVAADFHARAAMELMDAGCHVYVEKAPALDLEQMRQVFAAQRRTNKVYMTALKKRFAPAYVKAKAVILASGFGKPTLLTITRTSGRWGGKEDTVNTYLRENSIHVVDLAAYLFGPVRRVAAMAGSPATAVLTMEFQNGGIGNVSVTDRMSYSRGWEVVTAIGENGILVEVDNSVEMAAWQLDQPIASHKPEFVAGSSLSSVEQGFVGELQAFVDAIKDGVQPAEAGIADATHAMAILHAVRQSLKNNQFVNVETTI